MRHDRPHDPFNARALHLLDRVRVHFEHLPEEIVMAILDAVAAQVSAIEAAGPVAIEKIQQLATEKTALTGQVTALTQQVADLQAETAAAQALADRLKAAIEALQGAVAAAG